MFQISIIVSFDDLDFSNFFVLCDNDFKFLMYNNVNFSVLFSTKNGCT